MLLPWLPEHAVTSDNRHADAIRTGDPAPSRDGREQLPQARGMPSQERARREREHVNACTFDRLHPGVRGGGDARTSERGHFASVQGESAHHPHASRGYVPLPPVELPARISLRLMSDQRQPAYALLAGLTSAGFVLLLAAIFFLFSAEEVTTAVRWAFVAMMAGLASVTAFYLWRARQTRASHTASEGSAASAASPQLVSDRKANVAFVLGVLGAAQVAPIFGSISAIALARSVGTSPQHAQAAGRPRRAILAEALGWVGLAIFGISVIVYVLR